LTFPSLYRPSHVKPCGLLVFVNDVHALGLRTAQA
jgi:hypothetical protein